MTLRVTLLASLLSLAYATGGFAVSLSAGDLVSSSATFNGISVSGEVAVYQNDGTFKGVIIADFFFSYPSGIAQDSAGNVHVSRGQSIAVYSANGAMSRSYGGPGCCIYGLTIAANGHSFAAVGNPNPTAIGEFDEHGTLVATNPFSPTSGLYSLELDSDQCTLYYTDVSNHQRIGRVDVCTHQALPDFVPQLAGTSLRRIRLLRDGTMLAANGTSILRFARDGHVMQSYSVPGITTWHSVAGTLDGMAFWAGSDSGIRKFNLTSGAVDPLIINSLSDDLLVVGEYHAGLSTASIPALSPLAVAILGAALLVAAACRLS